MEKNNCESLTRPKELREDVERELFVNDIEGEDEEEIEETQEEEVRICPKFYK